MNLETYGVVFITFFIHSYLSMLLAKRITKKERFSRIFRWLTCLLNAALSANLIALFEGNNVIAYVVVAIVVIVEMLVLFKDKWLALIAISFGLLIHFYTCRSVVMAIYSITTEKTMFNILQSSDDLIASTFIVFWAHIMFLIVFIALISPSAVKDIIKNSTLLNFITLLMIVIGIFLIYNASIFGINGNFIELSIQQIVLPVLLLGTFYLMLLFMIRLVMLDKYKKLIQELEQKIDTSQMLKDALFNLAEIVIEFNSTKRKISRVIMNTVEMPAEKHDMFSFFINSGMQEIIHPNDLYILEKISPEKIEEKFKHGIKELNYDYRAYKISINKATGDTNIDKSEYYWYKMKINSRLDEGTKEILSICTIDEINDEKIAELALVEKSERDTLTGAYNKAAIRSLISDYLNEHENGVLIVFDLDNFKGINDNMGHNYGDTVLCGVYDKLRPLFRANDYIGRFGGDEFVVFLRGKVPSKEIGIIAKRLCDTVRNDYTFNDITVTISASIGIAIAPLNGTGYEKLFEAADAALYEAKRKGKDTFVIHSDV